MLHQSCGYGLLKNLLFLLSWLLEAVRNKFLGDVQLRVQDYFFSHHRFQLDAEVVDLLYLLQV